MKREKIENALNEISDSFIREAAGAKTKPRLAPWFGVVAAVLAAALIAGALWQPGSALPKSTQHPSPTLTGTPTVPPQGATVRSWQLCNKYALSPVQYPQVCSYPLEDDFSAYKQWRSDQTALHDQPEGYADSLQDHFAEAIPLLLKNNGSNAVCSPLNIYMALAMLAETTAGESRQQILRLLNADSIEALRTQAGQVWKAHYNDDGLSTSILGSSLWVRDDYRCIQETADLLAQHYYASVYSGDLGSEEMNERLRTWLSAHTGGLLDSYVDKVQLDPRTSLALVSTILYQVQWVNFFSEKGNTESSFHGTAGDTTVVFMNDLLPYGPYYWGDHFGAVGLSLEDGSRMWLFLPDEGTTPEQLMESGEVFSFLAQDHNSYENRKNLMVNLSLPKFDISCELELTQQLKALGITDVFQMGIADFSPLLQEKDGGFVSDVKHAARVAVDEEGVTAAAYTMIMRAGAGMPPEEEMDFVLDRPFVFVIESRDSLPLFAGIVNQP